MALIFADGFEYISSTTHHGRFDADASFPAMVTGRFGNQSAVRIAPGGGARKTLSSTTATLYFGFGLWFPSFTAGDPVFQAYDGANRHFYLTFTAALLMEIRNNAGTVLATSAAAFPLSLWRHINIKATIDAAAGNVEVRMDNALLVTFTGNTRNAAGAAGINKFAILGINSGTDTRIDDLYVNDGTGARCNGFMGDRRVETRTVASAGDLTQMTPTGAAANWDCCNDSPTPDDDTTYCIEDTNGQGDLYHLDPFVYLGAIDGVVIDAYCRKDDAGIITGVVLTKSGAVTTPSPAFALNSTYYHHQLVLEDDPATATQWTEGALNNLQIGTRKET